MKDFIVSLFKKYKELLRYLITGCTATLLNFIVYMLCSFIMGDALYLVSNVIAWILSTTFGFFTYKLWVFDSKDMHAKKLLIEGMEFYTARIITLLLESVGLWLLIDIVLMKNISFHFIIDITGEMIAKFIMLVITTVLNYIFSKFFIFTKKSGGKDQ